MKRLLGIISLVTAFAAQIHAQPFLTNGLVAYYPLNGNANDATTNGNNLVNFGATLCPDRFGNPSNAYFFNGSTHLGSSTPPLTSVDNWTLTAWISPASLSQISGHPVCVGEDDSQASSGYGFCLSGSNQYVAGNQLYACFSRIVFSPDNYYFPATNQWSQIVMVRSSGTSTLYVNGSATGDTYATTPLPPTAMEIGSAGGNYFFKGAVGDVRVYNRALSTNEIQELYAYEAASTPCTNPYPASAVATVVDGFCVMATVTDQGCGYSNAPLVLIEGGGGSGATAVANVTNGVVASITITDAGSNYSSTPVISIGDAPIITSAPQSLVVDLLGTASFSVGVSGGSALPSYQWLFNGTNISTAWSNISGVNSSNLVISNAVQTNLGTYTVIVTNYLGAVTNSATLSMYPYLATPFAGLDTFWGYTNTLAVAAGGSGPFTYQWYDDGVALSNQTNATLNFTGIQPTNAGLYSVVVTSPFGSVTNAAEPVVVNPAGVSFGGLYPSVLIQGVVGNIYEIQSTADLSDTNSWITVTNLTLTQPVQLFVDTNQDASQPANGQRFYRVLLGQ